MYIKYVCAVTKYFLLVRHIIFLMPYTQLFFYQVNEIKELDIMHVVSINNILWSTFGLKILNATPGCSFYSYENERFFFIMGFF